MNSRAYHRNAGAIVLALGFLSATPGLQAQVEKGNIDINAATLGAQGQALGTASERGSVQSMFQLQKALVYQMLQQAGINPEQLPPEIKASIDKLHTTNVQAFLAFSECLDHLDNGRYDQAVASCQKAVDLDPNFDLARQYLDAMKGETLPPAPGTGPSTAGKDLPASNPALPILNVTDTVQQQTGEGVQQQSSGQLGPGDRIAFFATFLQRTSCVDGSITSCPAGLTTTTQTGPYINFFGAIPLQSDTTNTLPQQRIGGGSTGFLKGMRFTGESGERNVKGVLTSFREDGSGEQNDTINVPLDRDIQGVFASSLQIGFFEGSGQWTDATGNSRYNLLANHLWAAVGVPTSLADIAALASAQTIATYQGTAGADILFNGIPSTCIAGTGCGTFSSVLDFGRGQVHDFHVNVNTGVAATSITSLGNVSLGSDGRFFLNVPDATYQIGASPNTLQPARNGGVVGNTFGPNAAAVGGTFIIEGNPNFVQGAFGGVRK